MSALAVGVSYLSAQGGLEVLSFSGNGARGA